MADYNELFLQHLEAIRLHTSLMAGVLPQQLIKLNEQMADVYKNAGPSRPTPGKRWGIDSGYSSHVDLNEAGRRARQQLYTDPYEAEIEGDTESVRAATGWRDRVRPGNLFPLPRYPGAEPNAKDLLEYASTVAANFAQKRQRVLDQRAHAAQQQVIDDYIAEGKITADTPESDYPEALQQQLGGLAAKDTRLGTLSNVLAGAESAYTQGRYWKGILTRIARPFEPMSPMRELGYQVGAQGSPAGPLGFRLPWEDPALAAGISQRWQQFQTALRDNISPGQASTIFQNLYQRGWLGGPQTDMMRQSAASMMNTNPYIASMPSYYDMMDKATRQGTTSLQNFNSVMKAVPDAAKAAHTSIQQTMADMDAMGQLNKQQGGTYISGLANAQVWQQVTGQPANILGTLMQNPLVQGQTFMQSGLLPWQQGLASPGQHIGGVLGALNLLNRSIIAPKGQNTEIGNTGFYNSVSGQDMKEAMMSHILGVSKEEIHTMLANQHGWQVGGNLSDEATSYATSVRNDVRRGGQVGLTDAQHQQALWAARQVMSGTGKGTWGQLKKDLLAARDSQGHPIIEDWNLYNKLRALPSQIRPSKYRAGILAQQGAMHDVQYAGESEAIAYMNKLGHQFMKGTTGKRLTWQEHEAQLGRTSDQMYWDAVKSGKLSYQVRTDMAAAQSRKIHDYQAMNTQKYGSNAGSPTGPRLTIELGPAAKKAFHLSDPTGQYKANNNAGSADIAYNPWAGGPTVTPFPNLDTSSGTYANSSPYDTASTSQ